MTSPTPSEPRTGHQLYHGAPFSLATSAKLVGIAVATIYVIQLLLVAVGTLDLVASVVADVVAIAAVIGIARQRGIRLGQLGLRTPRLRFVAGAILLGTSAWYFTAWLVVLLNPPGNYGKLEKFIEQTPLVPTLIGLAIVPALAEELVFRGVLLPALAARWRARIAIPIGALVFGFYHLFPPQIVSTFALALVIGFVTLNARSIVPAIIVHTLNNTIAIVLSRDEIPALRLWMNAHETTVLVGAGIAVVSGLALSTKGAA
jgi:uncharacterized protein